MVDLAMHMMDIAQNSIRAEARNIEIFILENSENNSLIFSVKDDGCGMSEEMIKKLSDPFFTSRTTRKVGLGVPFLKMTSEQTGGYLEVKSEIGIGTEIKAVYKTDNPDCIPLGDLAGYLILLLIGNPELNFKFCYQLDDEKFEISTPELAENGIDDLQSYEISSAVKEFINENLKEIFKKRKKISFLLDRFFELRHYDD